MADILMRPGWSNTVQIKTGATQLDIPVLSGSYEKNDGRIVEMLGQGNAQNAYPINSTKAPDSTTLQVSARAFSSWFTAPALNSLFIARDANGDLAPCDYKVANGTQSAVDGGKGSALRIRCRAGEGPITVDLALLGKAAGSTATFTGFTAAAGSPYYHNCVEFGWTAAGSQQTKALTLVEDFFLSLMTGVTAGKWFDCQDGMSNIDQGIQSGSLVITQRAGADVRMDEASAGVLTITAKNAAKTAGVLFTLQLVRLDVNRDLDPMAPGGAKVASSWAMLSADGDNPISITAWTPPSG